MNKHLSRSMVSVYHHTASRPPSAFNKTDRIDQENGDRATKDQPLEAVRLAKEALGDVPPQEMAAWIATNFGMTVQPVVVTIMLGSLLEREILERDRLKALELLEQAKAEQAAEKPKGRRKIKAAEKPSEA
jgi:hypothetical protein